MKRMHLGRKPQWFLLASFFMVWGFLSSADADTGDDAGSVAPGIVAEGRQNIDRQWRFSFGASSWLPFFSKKEWRVVDLPHDYSVIQERDPEAAGGDGAGFFPGGVAVYEKTLVIPDVLEGKRFLLEFEGVYMNSVVKFNDNIVARQPYGYTTFHCDVTPYVRYGQENIINVEVNNGTQPNSRWYSGSGIYRHVWLHVLEDVHISPWGVYATTSVASPDSSTVSVKTTVENQGNEPVTIEIRSRLLDASDRMLAERTTVTDIVPESSSEVSHALSVDTPSLWSVETPYLYSLRSEVVRNGVVIDSRTTAVGIRSISFDAENGFMLNGVPTLLKGGCVHSDTGILGVAAYDRAEERRVELMKASGFNAVRCAHNPPSPAFLDACDRLGLLVIDEAFDCWREGKNSNDYSIYFEDWWEKDLSAMILRDRSHPSVIMWSTGNEISEITGNSDGYAWARRLADFIRGLDDTRAVTNALQEFYLFDGGFDAGVPESVWNDHSSKFSEALDVVGLNYGRQHYESDGNNFPDRVIVAAESYPGSAYDYWEDVLRFPHVIGDFVWTAIDYFGEAGVGKVSYGEESGGMSFGAGYPWHLAYAGDLDVCGFKRPQSYYRDCLWGIAEVPYIGVLKPEHYGKTAHISMWGWPDVIASWTWPGYEGKSTSVDVYSMDDEVELILNGRSLGRQPAGEANRYTASFEVVYEAGELTAVGYSKGVEASRTSLKTAGPAVQLRLTPDRDVIDTAYGDLSYITVEMLDSAGNPIPCADQNITFTVQGPGTLLAVGSSDPKTEEMYVGNHRRLYNGRAMAVIRSDGTEGEIVLTVESKGVSAATQVIKVKNRREKTP